MKFLPIFLTLASVTLAADSLDPGSSVKPDIGDQRLQPLKDLDGYFPWEPSPTPEAWSQRAKIVRRQMQVSLGLHPWPTKTPLNPVVYGRIEREDYTVEKVYFESMPGFFVTGSLFRPRKASGPCPAVLCPHGHWPEGRFGMLGDDELKKEMARGEERFERGGRSRFQSLGVQLARMGCVAFVVDMIGYADSQQISFDLAHKFAKQRPEMISPEPGQWGFYSPQAESHGQSIMGLQTWNNIRALDFLTSLPDVDAKRIGCTGGSGGGTQTMILGALDPRLTVAFPAVMVSTAMQGGCTCENACGLRVGTGNVEFAALFAPKPMGMTSAKDWTIEMPTKGYPQLQQHWAMLGTPANVHLFPHPEFGHNYNIVTREHIYAWFNDHFGLHLKPEQLTEKDYEPLSREQLTVWDDQHPSPPGGPELEKKLLRWWSEDAKQQMEKNVITFREVAAQGVGALLGSTRENTSVTATMNSEQDPSVFGDRVESWTVRSPIDNEKTAAVVVARAKDPSSSIVIWLHQGGAEGLLHDPQLQKPLQRLIDAGLRVAVPDLFEQDADSNGEKPQPTKVVKNPREAAAYTLGYNEPLLVQRAHDVIRLIAWANDTKPSSTPSQKPRVAIVSLDNTAPVAALATALTGERVTCAVLDTGGFRFQNVKDIRDPMFLPNGARYGDLPGLLALGAPRRLFLMGEGRSNPGIANAAYEAAGIPDTVRVSDQREVDAAMTWLTDQLHQAR